LRFTGRQDGFGRERAIHHDGVMDAMMHVTRLALEGDRRYVDAIRRVK